MMDRSHSDSTHAHDQGSDHGSGPIHGHGAASPHPPQALAWSILRMTVVTRLSVALVVSAFLWATVWLATR